jgi:hypothetical protein
MFPTPDWVVSSPESLAKVLAKDLEKWSAQITMLTGSWMNKLPVGQTGLVTLELTTWGNKENLLDTEKLVVEALESIGIEEVVTSANQRGGGRGQFHSYIFYRPEEM